MLAAAGFTRLKRRGKGSHSLWRHPLLSVDINIAGNDSKDAKPYQEKKVREALELLKKMESELE